MQRPQRKSRHTPKSGISVYKQPKGCWIYLSTSVLAAMAPTTEEWDGASGGRCSSGPTAGQGLVGMARLSPAGQLLSVHPEPEGKLPTGSEL